MALISSPRPRLRYLILALALGFAVFFTFSDLGSGIRQLYMPNGLLYLSGVGRGELDAQVDFWRRFVPVLHEHAPTSTPPLRFGDSHLDIGFAAEDRPRPDLLIMPHNYVDAMKEAHDGFVANITFQLDADRKSLKIPYTPGTRGIVSTAGGSYLVVFVISLRMLRRTGSTLPVQVFLASPEEYEPHICNVVLPNLNAKCVVLSQILDAVPTTVEISHYQYKILSILFSSFEEVLLLDSDAFPVQDPDVLFDSEPFTTTGLVLWPDFWYMSESPAYFAISSQAAPSLGERQSTESGEILYSKSRHELSLLLATYYNIYGPAHYYPLQSQGAPGEGDKETYGWAAAAMGEPLYHVAESVRAIGVSNPVTGSFDGSAMVQYDPRDDYVGHSNKSTSVDPANAPADAPAVHPFFVHANFPKFDPATIWANPGPTRNTDGSFRRVWEDGETISGFGFDVERRFWEEIKWTACELETEFNSWKGLTGICDNAKEYWDVVFGQH
jgi:alpha 1,2-mannosyltransferase